MIVATEVGGILGVALVFATLCLILAFLSAAYRLLRGPSLADRVVGLDMVSMLLVVFLVVFKMISGVDAYMYVAIALALISFLGTVALTHYIDRSRGDPR